MAEESWDRCWELGSVEQRYFRIVIDAPLVKVLSTTVWALSLTAPNLIDITQDASMNTQPVEAPVSLLCTNPLPSLVPC